MTEDRAADERFRIVSMQAPVGIFETDVDGGCVWVNERWTEITGMAAADALGEGWAGALHPDDRAGVFVAWREAAANATEFNLEYRFRAPDGRVAWVAGRAREMHGQDGRVSGYLGTVADISERVAAEAEVRASEARYRTLARHLPGGAVTLFDRELRYLAADGPCLADFDLSSEAMVGKSVDDLFFGETLERIRLHYEAALGGEERGWEVKRNGRIYSFSAGPIVDQSGLVESGMVIVQDVTERARAEAEQAALRRVATIIAEDAGAPMVFRVVAEQAALLEDAVAGVLVRFDDDETGSVLGLWTADGKPPAIERIDLSGDTLTAHVYRAQGTIRHDFEPETTDPAMREILRRGYRAGIGTPITVGGKIWGSLSIADSQSAPIGAEERLERFAQLASTAVSNAAAWELLSEQAATDGVTGLPNYRTFQERLRNEIERAQRYQRDLSVAVFDIDHFKKVNDSYGHQAGDRVLAELGRRLAVVVRRGELVARVGGEEFAWILPETNGIAAYAAAERVRRAIEGEPIEGVGTVTVSGGVCSLEEAADAEALMRFADRALYWAKDNGRNATFRFTEEVKSALLEQQLPVARFQWMSSIRALARAIDAKDPSTRDHSERVAEFAEQLALAIGWPSKRAHDLYAAGLLHDVGKIGVPDSILLKPGKLTDDEYEEIKLHAALSAQIAAEVVEHEQVQWIRGHHERWDGRGYPDGLRESQIPDGAQILALSDAWDVMTTSRSYQAARPLEDALSECEQQAGKQFAPDVVEALLKLHRTPQTDVR